MATDKPKALASDDYDEESDEHEQSDQEVGSDEEDDEGMEYEEDDEEDEDEDEDENVTKLENTLQINDHFNNFTELGLDARIVKGAKKEGLYKPTPIQSTAIPLALQGKDILAKAPTGSGKTGAYILPILHLLLTTNFGAIETDEDNDKSEEATNIDSINNATKSLGVKVIILVPTAELCAQVKEMFQSFSVYIPHINILHLTRDIPMRLQKKRIAELPDVLIATPKLLLKHLQQKTLVVKQSLQYLVLDEADLLLSFGYKEDLQTIMENSYFPSIMQSFLVSATFNSEIEELRKLVLHNPAIIQLEEAAIEHKTLQQYSIQCPPLDKFLITFALLRLKLIKGKIILFVNSIERCFRLKLFLERFSIKSGVLNSELPANSRKHILADFNRGMFEYLIATDENIMIDNEAKSSNANSNSEAKIKKDIEYGVTRGVDFKDVAAVLNFDLPEEPDDYIHRIGRTARGGNVGTAVSFITPADEQIVEKIQEKLKDEGQEIKPYAFNIAALEGFRYRFEDAYKSVTKNLIKEARIKELKHEILNSAKLREHFQQNPRDYALLQHDQPLQQSRQKPTLKYIPEYLLPTAAVPKSAQDKEKSILPKKRGRDPLKSFTFEREKRQKTKEEKDKIRKRVNAKKKRKRKQKKFKSKQRIERAIK